MKKLARFAALSMVALLGLVPIQATPAGAFDGELDVESETGDVRIVGSIHRLTATLSGAMPNDGRTINFDTDDNPTTEAESCVTDSAGTCDIALMGESAGLQTIRAYVVDDGALPCSTPLPVPTSDCDPTEGRDEDAEEGATPEPDDTDVVEVEWAEGVLDVEPEQSAEAPATEVELTATVMSTETPPRGLLANVDAEILEGPNENQMANEADTECTTIQSGECTISYTAGAGTGVDVVQSWVDLNDDPDAEPETGDETDPEGEGFEGDASEGPNEDTNPGDVEEDDITDVVEVGFSGGQVLVLAPQSATKTVGSQSALTATVTMGGVPDSGEAVAGQVLPGGPNAGVASTCTTGANGQCTLNYLGANAGTDKIRATVDADGDGLPNEADATEDVGVAGGTPEPDATAVSTITWTAPEEDNRCENAKKKVKKLKKKFGKAKQRKRNACA